MDHRRAHDRGFTLVEILVAIVLVGIPSAVVVVGVGSLTSKGSAAACSSSLDAARAASTVHLTSTGAYPTTFTAMTTSGALSLPSTVSVDASGTAASGTGWTLTLSPGTGGSAPTFWCTTDLPVASPKLWLDATAAATITSTQTCTTTPGWRDRSGNGNDLLSPTPATDVTRSATALDGHPAIVTTGAAMLRTLRSPVARTVFVVARYTGAASSRILSSTSGNWLLGWWNGREDQAYFEGWVSGPNSAGTTTPRLYSATIDPGVGSTVWRNGTQIASNANGTALPAGLAVGGWAANAEMSAAAISEVITYDRALTATERMQTEQYLGDKWGLTVAATATPLMAPTPSAWFDATDPADFGASITSCSDSVTSWTDRSGHGYDLTPRTAGVVAASRFASINNLPVVTTSSMNSLVDSTLSLPDDATVFVVARYRGATAGRVLSAVNNNWLLGWWGGTQDRAHFTSWLPGSAPLTTQPVLYSAAIDVGVRADVFRNGAALTSSTTATAAPSGISIGGWPTSEFTQADVAEVIVYDRLLGTDERRAVETYLGAKWGLIVV